MEKIIKVKLTGNDEYLVPNNWEVKMIMPSLYNPGNNTLSTSIYVVLKSIDNSNIIND